MQLPRYGGRRHPHTYSRSACAPNAVRGGRHFMQDSPDSAMSSFPPQQKLTFKIPPNMQTRSTRSTVSGASGSGMMPAKDLWTWRSRHGERLCWSFFFLVLFLLTTAHHRTLIIQQELPEKRFGGIVPHGTDAMAGGYTQRRSRCWRHLFESAQNWRLGFVSSNLVYL